jgi:DNA-binding NarL/FixJ family response regulator
MKKAGGASDLRKYNVLIVDDHAMFREGLRNLFDQWQSRGIITDVANTHAILDEIREGKFDVIIVDIQMTGLDGLSVLREIKEVNPNQIVLVLTGLINEFSVRETIKLGVNAFLVKHETFNDLLKALETVVEGGECFSASISNILFKLLINREQKQNTILTSNLSPKEVEALLHICNQLNTDEIAEKMYISNSMVKKHRMSLMSKTKSKNAAGLFLFAIKNQFIQIDDLTMRR